jgi:hypothetical protein
MKSETNNFNCLIYDMGFDKEVYINVGLQRFQQICGTIIRTSTGMSERRHYLNSVRLWQFQLSFVDMTAGH